MVWYNQRLIAFVWSDAASMEITIIRQLCAIGALRWTDHAIERTLKRGISREDVKYIVMNGEIIEDYPEDYPYPSCLIFGKMHNGNPFHVVCGIGKGELWIITAYSPNLNKWNNNFKTVV